MSEANNSEEKLRWAFKMYDKDGSGSIEIDEMVEIVGNLFELEGLSKVFFNKLWCKNEQCGEINPQILNLKKTIFSYYQNEVSIVAFQDTALERATETFRMLDINGDGELNEDEFVAGCLNDKALADMLNAGHIM